jgi:hypothetical protein
MRGFAPMPPFFDSRVSGQVRSQIAGLRQPNLLGLALLLPLLGLSLSAQVPAALTITPNIEGSIDHPLRYRPEGTDFVIENGVEFFNRPLYGGNTGFRADAGDRPEFTLYFPGRGGNLRLGFRTAAGTKWLFEASRVVARYRPGSMLYEISDPALGASGVIHVEVMALADTEGLTVRAELSGMSTPVELTWAYGGITGQRGVRDGDIGTERVPISEYFQLLPEYCAGNSFEISSRRFVLRSTPATIVGHLPAGSSIAVADATQWDSWDALLASSAGAPPELPVAIGQVPLTEGEPVFLALQRTTGSGGIVGSLAPEFPQDSLPAVQAGVDRHP